MAVPSTSAKKKLATAAKAYHEQLEESDAPAYLTERGLDRLIQVRHGLGCVVKPVVGHEHYAGRVSIPYVTPTGVVQIKFRCIEAHSCEEVGCPKYLGITGAGVWMYNTRAFLVDSPVIGVAEGEIDALSVQEFSGIPCVGFPGATTAVGDETKEARPVRHSYWLRAFTGYQRVLVFGDGDSTGRRAANGIAKNIIQADAVIMPDGEDPNSLLTQDGGLAEFRRLCGFEEGE